ncbi:hypothetical protein TNCV_2585231, partial [Trichonephila clavipes]
MICLPANGQWQGRSWRLFMELTV